MSEHVIFELCAETLEACEAARDGGADRIELCSALSEDGLTPSHGLSRAAVAQSGLPVHVLVRPRTGDFVYSEAEFALLREDVMHARTLGASGVVIGILLRDGRVDIGRTSELVALAAPVEVTFHRAFDLTPELDEALEAVIATGCHRLLTSGGQRTAIEGADTLSRLVSLGAGRIEIAAGGGLRPNNAAELVQRTRVKHVHSSLRRKVEERSASALASANSGYVVDVDEVRSMVRRLSFASRDLFRQK